MSTKKQVTRRKKTTIAKANKPLKASGRMPLWATTKPKRAYVIAMRTLGKPYNSEAYPAYRKSLKISK